MIRKNWTYPEIERLKQMRGTGRSQPEMAIKLGRSLRSVESMCWELVRAGKLVRITRAERGRIIQRARGRSKTPQPSL